MWVRIAMLVLFLSGSALANFPQAADSPGLFGPGEPLDAAQATGSPEILRARSAGLNLSIVELVHQELAAGQVSDPVSLNIFPDVQLTARFSRLEPSSAGGITLAGKIDGSPLSEIHLSQVGTAFFASLNTPQGLFRAASSDGQTARVWQVDPAGFPKEDEAMPVNSLPVSAAAVPDVLIGPTPRDDGSRIDVYVGYTT
ncbi:MAG: hypothetical protein Q7U75_04590, partial [Desulfobacterales bacterium]|nr:hypothetical protein [Desulfobacterales bacterium]